MCLCLVAQRIVVIPLGVAPHHIKNDFLYQFLFNKKQPVVENNIDSLIFFVPAHHKYLMSGAMRTMRAMKKEK
jgi:TRAP-type mannitol/chloroaromatic compound transport system permease small subunit